MRNRRAMQHDTPQRRGFTIVEMLVAIIVLLVGVVVALRVFPRGFEIFGGTQQTYAAQTLANEWVAQAEQYPEQLPEAFLPVEYEGDDANTTVGNGATPVTPLIALRNFDWTDLSAIHNQAFGGDVASYLYHSSVGDRWPLWEPLGVRVLRRVIGEPCTIPSDLSSQSLCDITSVASEAGDKTTTVQVTDATDITPGMVVRVELPNNAHVALVVAGVTGTSVQLRTNGVSLQGATRLASVGSFAPRYIVRYGPIAFTKIANGDGSSRLNVDVYDLRYRRVSTERLEELRQRLDLLPDKLYYAMNYRTGEITLLPDAHDRYVRVLCYQLNTTTGDMQLAKKKLKVAGTAVRDALVTATVGATVVPGSEQLNRLFQYVDLPTQNWAALSNLQSGQFSLDLGAADDAKVLPGQIFFSRADAGRTVKIDYTVADWNILHEDVTVDGEGQLQFSFSPKMRMLRTPPREFETWGLYGPMRQDAVVMALINLRTGALSEVTVKNPSNGKAPTQPNDTNSGTRNYPVFFTDATGPDTDADGNKGYRYYLIPNPRNSARWKLVHDGENANFPDTRFKGQVFRIYYRAQHDWTVQVFRAPAAFWFKKASDTTLDALKATVLDWQEFSWCVDQAQGWVAVPGVYAGQSIAVDYQRRQTAGDDASPLLRVTGEVHTIPARLDGKGISLIKLRYQPAANTTVAVRGISFTVRAIWTQKRSGDARVITGLNGGAITEKKTTIRDRWLSKQRTLVLPTVLE